ncbi:MAG: M23 family metallopeptidase [Pseudomonadota bacterium]
MLKTKPSATLLAIALPTTHRRALATLLVFLFLLLATPLLDNLAAPFESAASHEQLISPETVANPALAPLSPAAPPPPQNTKLVLEVKNGDTLSSLFKKAGFDAQLLDDLVQSSGESKVLSNIFPDDTLTFEIAPDQSLISLDVSQTKFPLESFKFTLNTEGRFDYNQFTRTADIKHVTKDAVITESLFLAAQKGDIPADMTMELASIFGGVIDFILDTREGDTFRVIYEERYLDGKQIPHGNILAAEFVNQGKKFAAVRYVSADGSANFYSPAGESMRKAFLLNPVDFTRISSGFNLSRKHPILNTIRAHKGTDYAAPRGTPVVATADGRVTFADRNGSFGKLIVVQHGDRFVSKYAHLNDYKKGIKAGVRVRQGDVLGYVGSTGGATGPHLHYEFLMDGVHRDSRRIFDQLPQAESIAKAEMPAFRQQTDQLLAILNKAETSTSKVAAAQGTAENAVLME